MSSRSRQRPAVAKVPPRQPQSVTTATFEARYVRAFPEPEELERYEALHPGFAATLLSNWEAQSNHRMALEDRVIRGDIRRSNLGLVLGTAVVLFTVGCGTFLIAIGRDAAGLAAIVTALGGLVAAMAYGTYQRNKRRDKQ